jgi:hypothetical protein
MARLVITGRVTTETTELIAVRVHGRTLTMVAAVRSERFELSLGRT